MRSVSRHERGLVREHRPRKDRARAGLVQALREGQVGGATRRLRDRALAQESELYNVGNVILTHISGGSTLLAARPASLPRESAARRRGLPLLNRSI